MDELIRQVVERTGISDAQARQAVETVVGFLKARLPDAASGYVDTALNNQQAGDALGSVADKIGGLFGGE